MRPKAVLLRILPVILVFTLGNSRSDEVSAGVNVWTSNGPEGWGAGAMAIDPITPSTVYIGTSSGGVFKSADGGANWRTINAGLSDTYVMRLAIDPTTPSTIFVGTSMAAYSRAPMVVAVGMRPALA
ncbi:MAG: hypothetical protein HYX94_07915 [Chloroflexi bacterium]|nr:hypothetical protein [Chloroflexota bacterium]